MVRSDSVGLFHELGGVLACQLDPLVCELAVDRTDLAGQRVALAQGVQAARADIEAVRGEIGLLAQHPAPRAGVGFGDATGGLQGEFGGLLEQRDHWLYDGAPGMSGGICVLHKCCVAQYRFRT